MLSQARTNGHFGLALARSLTIALSAHSRPSKWRGLDLCYRVRGCHRAPFNTATAGMSGRDTLLGGGRITHPLFMVSVFPSARKSRPMDRSAPAHVSAHFAMPWIFARLENRASSATSARALSAIEQASAITRISMLRSELDHWSEDRVLRALPAWLVLTLVLSRNWPYEHSLSELQRFAGTAKGSALAMFFRSSIALPIRSSSSSAKASPQRLAVDCASANCARALLRACSIAARAACFCFMHFRISRFARRTAQISRYCLDRSFDGARFGLRPSLHRSNCECHRGSHGGLLHHNVAPKK
jgi:hypothetical protein